jgi:hypothetical protein
METTKKIVEIFDHAHDNFEFELYFLWCESVTVNTREFQKVLCSRSVKRWFDVELEKQISEYEFLINQYPNASDDDCFQLYINCIYKLFSHSPKALLYEVKKQEKATKVLGIKIESSILKLN